MDRDLLRALWRRVTPHRRILTLVGVLTLLSAAVSLAQPALIQQVVAGIDEDRDVRGLVVAVVAVVLLGSVLSATTTYLLPRVGLDVVLSARRDLSRHLLRLPVAVLDQQRIGDLLSRVGADTTLLQAAITGGVIQGVSGLVVAVGAMVAMALVDLTLLGVVIGVVAVGGRGDDGADPARPPTERGRAGPHRGHLGQHRAGTRRGQDGQGLPCRGAHRGRDRRGRHRRPRRRRTGRAAAGGAGPGVIVGYPGGVPCGARPRWRPCRRRGTCRWPT